MKLQCVSFEFKNANQAVKERLVINEVCFVTVYNRIRETLGIAELLILSTCNRTEFYFFSDTDQTQDLEKYFQTINEIRDSHYDHVKLLLISNNDSAMKHLSEVSLGVHSQVLGDVQVINQVKKAYKKASELGGAQLYLHKIMHRIFALNKQVTNQTKFKNGVSSISSATIQFVKRISKAKDTPILILGTGESGRETIKNLLNSGYQNITVVNRTTKKAVDVAKQFEIKSSTITNLRGLVESHKIIISSLSTNDKVINRTNVPMELSTYDYRYFLDLSVLGVVDVSIEENPENLVFSLKYMTEQNEETKKIRRNELPEVNKIIQEEVDALKVWFFENRLLNQLSELKKQVTKVNQLEVLSLLRTDLMRFEDKVSPEFFRQITARCMALCERENSHFSLEKELYSIFNVEEVKSKYCK